VAGNKKALQRSLMDTTSFTEDVSQSVHPIHLAAYNGRLEFLQDLFRYTKDPKSFIDARTRETGDLQLDELEAKIVFFNETKDLWQLGENIPGGTPLHFAAANKHIDVVEFLIREGANMEVRDEYGLTAIQHAVEEPVSADVFQLLAVAGANVNTRDYRGNTPFMRAAMAGAVDTLRVMGKYNIEIGARTIYGETALHLAIDSGKTEAAELLITLGLDLMTPDSGGQSAIQTAVYEEQYTFASKHLPEVDSLDNNIEGSILNVATACAAGSDNNALVEKLLVRVPNDKANEYVNFCSAYGTPLYCSAFRGKISVMESLLLKGAQVNLVGGPLGTPLIAACTMGRVEAVSFLLKRGATLDFIKEDGTIASAFEAARDHDEVLMLLERFESKGIEGLDEPLPHKKANISKVDEILAVFEARKIATEE
jgi:ankyrin repeat protein